MNGDDLSQAFTITQTLKFWRFVISELKQQEAFYHHKASEAEAKGEIAELFLLNEQGTKCGDAARLISSQIERQKR